MPEPDERKKKTPRSFRISDQGEKLLAGLANRLGVTETAVIEMSVRRMAQSEGISTETEKEAVAA